MVLDEKGWRTREGGENFGAVLEETIQIYSEGMSPDNLERLIKSKQTAAEMLAHIQISEQDTGEPVLRNEKLLITCLFANAWDSAHSLETKRKLMLALSHLWSSKERRKVGFDQKLELSGFMTNDVGVKLLQAYFPGWDGVHYSWFTENKLDVNGIVTLPDKGKGFIRTQDEVFKSLEIKMNDPRWGYVGGFANSEAKLAFLPESATEQEKEHERLHLTNVNIRHGTFEIALNEAVTELISWENIRGSIPWWHKIKIIGNYSEEVSALLETFRLFPKLAEAIRVRYKELTLDSSKAYIREMINAFSLEGFLTIIRAKPGLSMELYSEEREEVEKKTEGLSIKPWIAMLRRIKKDK